jgi:hypothetical protein
MFVLKRKYVVVSKKRSGLQPKSMAEIAKINNDIKKAEAKEHALIEQQINKELSQI